MTSSDFRDVSEDWSQLVSMGRCGVVVMLSAMGMFDTMSDSFCT